jgi:hypothetical protein
MPYAILVSALGAIVSTAIAMFVMHSWSATKIAPAVGAILGLIVGIATLRLRGLPLRATLDEYRAAGGGESGSEILSLYLKIALNAAIVVSIVELPVFSHGEKRRTICGCSGLDGDYRIRALSGLAIERRALVQH